ncbi:hypothetical protein ACFQMA_17845 [Halosimplex aquaticum]|uniref:Amphi-Trp domain-containing protein n=1 Tax=Halosimplex aquaticum TaxID=3026162 RepID=A0ABD5Y2L1_9EURY|nr:hypothetical protein [Halosimplex aquaticum]
MGERRSREDRIAADLESIAAQLREGEATLYGYEVDLDAAGRVQRGGITCADGWFAFEFDERRKP